MKQSDLISVIVPVYNVEKYLRKCIDSIVNQTYKNLEIILVDDGSTDGSGKICDEYAEKDSRIRVIHKENGGQATARNAALDIVTGSFIAFADSDDWLSDVFIEKMYSEILRANADISVCARMNIFADGRDVPAFNGMSSAVMNNVQALKNMLIYNNMDAAPWDKLYKSTLLKTLRFPTGYICEDIPFVFGAVMNAEKVVYINKPLYYYLQRQGSTSRSAFAEKSKGLEIYHRQAANMVIKKFPELKKEADYFSAKGIVHLFLMMNRNECADKEYYEFIKKQVIKNRRLIMTNSGFSRYERMVVYLCCIGLYPFLKKIKTILVRKHEV